MARMECKCGMLLDNHDSPNDIELIVYEDREWEDIFSKETIDVITIPLPKYNVWKCPKCKRLYIFENSNMNPIMIYKLEE